MKSIILRLTLIATICCAATFSSQAQQASDVPLTNSAVVKLVRAGFKEKTVITIIRNRPSRFQLDPDRLIELKRNGVSENIILAMLAQDELFALGDDDWPDDSGFRMNRSKPGDRNGKSGGTDIFGGGSSSSSQANGRGMDGANQGETTTTGSATVRILRPPSEAGAQLKLEKTPTLTNDSVIKLVEAGFSEGTIIKRIEDSPADFDLSSAKLDELRRRRVTEAIIVAMANAMGDESGVKQTSPSRIKGK